MYNIEEYLAPHFQLKEFLHNESLEGVTPFIYGNLKNLAARLSAVRQQLGDRRITINSGFRTKQHNAEVGGKPDSQHLLGKAADIEVDGMKPSEVQNALKKWQGGMGSYNSFTHLDIRPWNARWVGP